MLNVLACKESRNVQASTMKNTIIPHLLPRWTAQRAEIILEGILKDLEGNNRTF